MCRGPNVGVDAVRGDGRRDRGGPLLLDGDANSAVTIVLTQPAVLHLEALVPDARTEWSGVALRSAAGNALGVGLQVRRWVNGAPAQYSPRPVSTVGAEGLQLRPGRYRLELLASGRSSVRIPATGQLVRRVHTTSRVAGTPVRLTDLRTMGLPVGNHRTSGVAVGRLGLAVLVFHARSTAHQLSFPQICFATPGSPSCANNLGVTVLLASPGTLGDGYVQSFTAVYGASGGAGVYDALVQDVTVDVPRQLDSLLVVL